MNGRRQRLEASLDALRVTKGGRTQAQQDALLDALRSAWARQPHQEVTYRFKAGIRYGMSKQELRCVVVNPEPFPDEWNGEPRLRVRCIEPDDPMNGHEFVPFVAALEAR